MVALAFTVSPADAQESGEFNAALQMYLDGNYAAAVDALTVQIEQGGTQAMSLFVFMVQRAGVVADNVPYNHLDLLERAADHGDAEALMLLGTRFIGTGRKEEGRRLLRGASSAGHPEAPFFLGLDLAGRDTNVDEHSELFELALSRGHQDAWGAKILMSNIPVSASDIQSFDFHRFDGTQ